jgi:hypothetical protein
VKFRLPSFLASKSEPVVSAARVELRLMAAWSPLEALTPRTLAAALNGYNRRQRVLDFVGLVAEKKAVSVFAGGGQVKVSSNTVESASTAPASTMLVV